MADLRVGNRIPVFVTHVEFQNSGCQAFVHVGDLGSQADTVIERTDEYVGSGGAEIPSSCSIGDLCLALFHEDNGWYRAQVLSVSGNSVTVFFIDYGNTETVKIDNLRNASDFVLAIPPLTTKCQVADCIPLNEQSWTDEETKKIESMLHSQEFIAEIVTVDPSAPIVTCNVKLFKTDEPSVPVFLRKSSSSSDLTVKLEELQIGQDYTVFISFVDSTQKFWVQLKQKENELNSLMSDIGACFAEDLPSSGDIVKPTLNQICASCFSEDGSFYRAKVQSISGDSCKVFFVDYGNSENKSSSELFTLPQVLAQLPMQAIRCSYKSISDLAKVEDILHSLETDGTPCVIKAVSKSGSGYVVQIDAVEKQLNVNQVQSQSARGKGAGKLWTSLPSVVMQVGSVYDVCVSHVEHPGHFFVQLIGNASKLDDIMQSIDEVAHNLESLIIANPGTLCVAKFSDNAWYRSEILSADDGRLTVGAIDFGFTEEFSSRQMLRKIDPKFKELPAQSILCSLDSEKHSSRDWSEKDVLKFNALAEKTALVCRVSSKDRAILQVDLFDTTNDQERHINQELAVSLNGPVSTPIKNKSIPNSIKPQMKLPPPQTTLGSQMTLCVTALKSTLVFGQVTNTPVEKVAKLQTDLNEYYDKTSTESLVSVDLGSVCCTQYSDGGWYRGIVTSVQGGEVEVSFADFGDSIMKSKSDLKALVPSLCELPQQCVLVSIENLPSLPGNKLETVLVNKRIDVKLKSKEDGVYPQFSAELLSQSVLDELQGKPAAGFGAKFGQSRNGGQQRTGFGGNRDGGFGRNREEGSGDSGFGAKREGFGGRRDGGGFGSKQDGGFGESRGGGFGDRKSGGFGGGGGGGGGKGCFKCGEEGHMSRDCPKGGGKGCFKCGEEGHMSRDCPKGGGGKGCFKCGEEGHISRDCPSGGGFGGQREERGGFGNNTERSGFGDRKEGGGFGDRKGGGFGGNRGDSGGFGKREGGFGSRGGEDTQDRGFSRGPRAPSGDSGAYAKQVVDIGSTKGVMVTYVRDPGHFQVVLEDMSDSLDVVMDQLHAHYDKLPPNGEQLENPHLGQACVAQYSEDKGWYRAIISGLLSNGLSEVMFVDYGNNECTPRETLKVLKDEFLTLPAQAILCSLAGVAPSQGFWSPEHTVQFEEMVVEQSFKATFKSQSREPGQEVVYKVELLDKKNVSINQQFGSSTGTTCVETGPGPSSRTVTSGGSGMSVTVSDGNGWDEGPDTGQQPGFGQGRKFGGDRGGGGGFRGNQGEERGFGSRDRGAGFGNSNRDRNDRGFGERKGGFGGNREGGFNNRDQGREGGFQRRQDGEGGGFGGGKGGFNKDGGFGSRGGGDRRGGFGQSGDSNGESSGSGFGQRNDRDSGGSRGGGFGQRSGGFGQSGDIDGAPRGGGFGQSGDRDSGSRGGGFGQRSGGGFGKSDDGGQRGSGFGQRSRDDQGGFGGRKVFDRGGGGDSGSGFGGNKGGFGGNRGGFSGGGSSSSAAAEDDWDTDTVAVPVSIPAKPAPQQTSGVKRFRGLNSVDEDTGDDVFINLNLNVRESVDVYVVYTVNPDLFYCQVIKNSSSLSELMTQMNSFYEGLTEVDMTIERPEIGMPCAAKFSEDDTWYRAEIQTPGQMKTEVQFIDYGNSEMINVSKIRQLKPEFMKLKSQGIKCGLDGVVAKDNAWSDKSVEDFEDLTIDKHLVAKIINRSSDGTHLLELENVEEKISIGDSMCEKGHCSYVSSKLSPKKDQVIDSPYPTMKLEVDSEVDVYVSCIENPELFWVQPVSDEEKLIQFVDSVQEVYTSGVGTSLNVSSVMPGQAVIALFSEDEAWYRGYVEKKSAKDINVRFVDYGNCDTVTRESMRQPTEEMLKETSHAVQCKLKGVKPLQTGVWTSDAKDIMNSLVADKVVKCKILEKTGKLYTVQLTAEETDMTMELIQAAVVRAEKEPSPLPGESTSVQGERVKTLFFKNQASVDVGSTEPVYVTQTDSVASFWCQQVKYYSKLDDLMGNLEIFCNSKPAAADFSVHMACGAKFSGDGSWYRAKVTAVYPDSVEVLFVDYGNSEKVVKSDIRNLTEELTELPTQAIHCTLENYSTSTNQLTKKFLEMTSDVEVSMTSVEYQEDVTVVRLALTGGENVAEQLGLVEQVKPADSKESKALTGDIKVAQMPTDEKYPKAKVPSTAVQVYVSNVTSPGDFHIQLVDQEAKLNELMEKVAATFEDETKFKIASFLEGQSCCSKFLEDGQWYRAEALYREGSDAVVRFVDYGNDQRTTMNNVRNTTDELVRIPPFAYHCKLANVGMADGSPIWSPSAVERFESLVVDQELACEFMSDKEVNLTLDGEDIAEKLLEVGGVVRLTGETKQEVAVEMVKIDFRNYKVAEPSLPTEPSTCHVAHVRTNGLMYLQLVHEEEKLNTLTESLQEKAVSLQAVPLDDLKIGDFCIAKFSEDQAWYRATVETVSESSVTVRYMDYGNSDKVENSGNLKCPTAELANEHPYAYECKLQGVANEAPDADKLHEITADKELSCVFRSSEVPYEVELHNEEGENIADLVRTVSEEMVTAATSDSIEASPTDTGTAEIQSKETAEVNVDLGTTVYSLEELKSESLEHEQRTRVTVSHANSPSEFWVQLVNKKSQLDELLNRMFDLYTATTDDRLKVDSVDKNMVVAALFPEDELWYRGKIMKVGEEEVTVQFLDHGNQERVSVASLRKLLSVFSELPLQAIQCSLAGVVPKDGGDWSTEMSDTFTEITLEKELLLDVCGQLEGGVYQVQLLEMGVPVSETLVKRGVGVELATPIPVSTKTKQVFSPESKEEIMARLFEPKASEKFTRYGYKMRDFGMIEPTIDQPAIVRVINSPTDFWCQISDNSYEYLQEKLSESYIETCEKLKDFEVGVRCVLKLSDNEFFRGSVIDLDSELDKVTVLCVDNGYRHEVSKSGLLEYKAEFDKFPQLAFPCAFDVRTSQTDTIWDKAVCEKFQEIVLELGEVEQLPAYGRLTIVRLKDDDTAIVRLTIDRLSIGDHLVTLELAEVCNRLEELEIKEKLDAQTSQKLSEFGSFLNIQLPEDSENDVHLIDCDNLDRLVFHTSEGEAVVEEMMGKIVEYVKDREPSEGSWIKGQSCLVKCPEDDLWYRASIVAEMQEKYQVFLVDYGSFYTIPGASLLPIPDNLLEMKAQAVICKLSEVEPLEEDWSEEAVDFFSGHFCHDEPTTLCLYISKYESGVHEVTLSQRSEEKTANMLMAELGYAIPVLGSALEIELLTDQAETSFHEMSLAKEDSFDSELGDTSYEGDTTNITTDASYLEHDTSGLDTETSHIETDTSCVEVDQSGLGHDITADRSGLETDLSRLDIDKSKLETENDESYLETDQSYLDTEPSYLEGDTTRETDMSELLEADRSELETNKSHLDEETSFQETDTSATEVDTSYLHTDTSCLETTDTSCLETTDTSYLDTDISALETDTTETSVTESDSSVLQAPKIDKECLIPIKDGGIHDTKDEMNILENGIDDNSNIVSPSNDICLCPVVENGLETSGYEAVEESSLDESQLNFSYSPTGYTTSELDTTDMTGLESTANISALETTTDMSGLETTTDINELETTTDSLHTIDKTGFTELDSSSATCHKSDTETADEGGDTDLGNEKEGTEREAETQISQTETDLVEISKQYVENLIESVAKTKLDDNKVIEHEEQKDEANIDAEQQEVVDLIETKDQQEKEEAETDLNLESQKETVTEMVTEVKIDHDYLAEKETGVEKESKIESQIDSLLESKKELELEISETQMKKEKVVSLEKVRDSEIEFELVRDQTGFKQDRHTEDVMGNDEDDYEKENRVEKEEKCKPEKETPLDASSRTDEDRIRELSDEVGQLKVENDEIFQSDDEITEAVDSNLTNVTAMTHPNLSDATFHSVSDRNILMNEQGGRLFRTVTESRTDSIGLCESCGSDMSSFLDTTGCSSEFSFYVCYDCQQRKEQMPETVEDENTKEYTKVFEIAPDAEDSLNRVQIDYLWQGADAEKSLDSKLNEKSDQDEISDLNAEVDETSLDVEQADKSEEDKLKLLDKQKEEQDILGQYSAIVLTPLKTETEPSKQGDESAYENVAKSDQLEVTIADKQKRDQDVLGQYSAVVLEPLHIESDQDGKENIQSENGDNNKVDEEINSDQLDEVSEKIDLIDKVDENESLPRTEVDQRNIVPEHKLDGAVGEQKVDSCVPVDILEEVSSLLSKLQDRVCESGIDDETVAKVEELEIMDDLTKLNLEEKLKDSKEEKEMKPERRDETIVMLEKSEGTIDDYQTKGDDIRMTHETDVSAEPKPDVVIEGDTSTSCAETVLESGDRDSFVQTALSNQGLDQPQLPDDLSGTEGDTGHKLSADGRETANVKEAGTSQMTTNGNQQEEMEDETIKEANGETEEPKVTAEEAVNNDAENVQGGSDSRVTSKTGDLAEINGDDSSTVTTAELKPPGKVRELAQSDDSDTETFEDADVSMGETDIAGGKREMITPDKDSTEDSEAFYDVESEEEGKVKEIEGGLNES